MYSKALALALALTSVVTASPLDKRQSDNPCQVAYRACIASGVPIDACRCDSTFCLGEDNDRIRSFCATATATIVRTSTQSTPAPTSTESCTPYSSATPTPTSFSSISGIPGGCNPAHPGSCPTPTAQPSVSVPAPTGTPGSSPTKTDMTWALNSLTRYCGEGNTGCDYNFEIEANGKTERCTVIRMPGKDAATESWSNQACSDYTVSWGYVAQPAPAFAVVTVVNGKELAWFGVSDINGQAVTASNPFGSGQYPNTTSPVYTY
ncbi:uncharacterized protein M421DRAFT_420905 [Didymella exigua CBS 183.55]|uniref:Extracellular membrane protein CFEM domain-containing protein n=1 Tax=Didymella exigua CBS 183.55 TaxID=1150837 RepID=A0A6A5RJ08_9PLEO|nr:uncharacterized protein M421DRAFT_420905 [Didymella exigua CBS 183.55]KAF1928361.1 hypothetical protein M421DRAFT_420905 [Didymella exigua CBS 183.55]